METSNDKEFFFKLIKSVQDRPCLYEKKHFNYYNRKKRDEAWQEVAAECNRSASDCKARWKLLRERFCKHIRSLGAYSLLATNASDTKKWDYYKEMLFLKESIVPRRSCKEKEMSSSLDEPTINEVFINVNSMAEEEETCSLNSDVTNRAKLIYEYQNKSPAVDLQILKVERLSEAHSLNSRESERTVINSTTAPCDTPKMVIADNMIDELFAKNIATLMRELPIEIKDRFQANMYAEVFRLRASYLY
ncbi:uncharacterized protein [Eurosta solidaginis]|uniref:uncharacterized protein n=1 Tax=Eurosta solidaginis TaxID=178769 RepID=UPI0035309762